MKGKKIQMRDFGRNGRPVLCLLLWIGMISLVIAPPSLAQGDAWRSLGIIRLSRALVSDFTLPSLEGRSVSLSDFKGKVVFITFWTTWCPPCKEEMASLERLYREFRDKGFTILAVSIMERADIVKKFAGKNELSFPILIDAKGAVSEKYAVTAIPATYIVDRDGRAIGRLLGPREWDGVHAKAVLRELGV